MLRETPRLSESDQGRLVLLAQSRPQEEIEETSGARHWTLGTLLAAAHRKGHAHRSYPFVEGVAPGRSVLVATVAQLAGRRRRAEKIKRPGKRQ